VRQHAGPVPADVGHRCEDVASGRHATEEGDIDQVQSVGVAPPVPFLVVCPDRLCEAASCDAFGGGSQAQSLVVEQYLARRPVIAPRARTPLRAGGMRGDHEPQPAGGPRKIHAAPPLAALMGTFSVRAGPLPLASRGFIISSWDCGYLEDN